MRVITQLFVYCLLIAVLGWIKGGWFTNQDSRFRPWFKSTGQFGGSKHGFRNLTLILWSGSLNQTPMIKKSKNPNCIPTKSMMHEKNSKNSEHYWQIKILKTPNCALNCGLIWVWFNWTQNPKLCIQFATRFLISHKIPAWSINIISLNLALKTLKLKKNYNFKRERDGERKRASNG